MNPEKCDVCGASSDVHLRITSMTSFTADGTDALMQHMGRGDIELHRCLGCLKKLSLPELSPEAIEAAKRVFCDVVSDLQAKTRRKKLRLL